jgi:hypothetical protein
MELTRVDDFGGWWVKREDTAAFAGLEYPSGDPNRWGGGGTIFHFCRRGPPNVCPSQ